MMIITCLMGGLGNQMFQYAIGRAVSLRLGAELRLDCSWFGGIAPQDAPRRYMLGDAFAVSAEYASDEDCARFGWRKEHPAENFLRRLLRRPRPAANTCVQEPHFAYWPGIETISAPAYLYGYWQNERYFIAVADWIRRDFAFPPFAAAGAEDLAREIRDTEFSVCVHVRRGDYASNPHTQAVHGLCSPEYYKKALLTVAGKTGGALKLFLFSDEPAWVREHFDCRGFPAIVADFPAHAAAPWQDMHLMSLCRHHIIANSSFSWWAAWLGEHRGAVTIAPAQWFAAPAMQAQTGDLLPEHWMRL